MLQPDDDFERDTRAATALSIPLAEFILPLFADSDGKYPEMIGTGFLVEDRGSTFLISAAHVLDRALDLYFYVDKAVTRMLSGRISKTLPPKDGPRTADHLDVAVLKLEGEGLPPYPGLSKRAMPISMLLPSALPRDDKQYLIVGFPSSKSKANRKDREVNSQPVSFRNISATLSQYGDLGVLPETHIVLPLDLKKTVASDGTIKPFFSPHGLSGSPLFCLPQGWNKGGSTPVVGVVIEHHKNERAAVATDIALVVEMIRAAPRG
jgi:Trypsin-like peptidase domain